MAYWEERALQIEQSNFEQSLDFINFMTGEYLRAKEDINARIYNHLKDMADINNISLSDVKRMMNDKDLDLWKTSLNEFREKSKGILSPSIERELDTISKRVRISYLQAMETDLKIVVDKLINEEYKSAYNSITEGYKETYYHQTYDLQKVTGYEVVSGIDERKLKALVYKPWASDGLNFSDRIWSKKNKLINSLHKELTQSLIGGTTINQITNKLVKDFEVSEYQAKRLIRTEMSAIRSQATKDSYGDLNNQRYQILATLDTRTSDICRRLDGEIFNISDYKVGITAPPFHPFCRSTTIPYIEGETDTGTRVARDPVTGETVRVNSKLKYQEWFDMFVRIAKKLEELNN